MNTKRVAHMTLSTLFCSLFGFLGGCGDTTDTVAASPPPPAVTIATSGSNAIQNRKLNVRSEPCEELNHKVDNTPPVMTSFSGTLGGVFTVSEPDTNCRAATATANRTVESLSLANLPKRCMASTVG